MKNKIFISQPYLDNYDKKNLVETFDSTWISSNGNNILNFEKSFQKYTGSNYSLTCSNGTIAIELALKSLKVKSGDEVIVPNLTFAATINAVINVGATPVLVDVNRNDFGFNKDELTRSINKKTFAIIFVHLLGIPVNIKKNLSGIKKKFFIIEDCAESLGAKIDGVHTGFNADCSTFSFFSNKIITTGEGGMINFKNKNVFNLAKKIKNQGRLNSKYYWHDKIGGNYRLTNMQASIGISQLKKINNLLKMRKEIYKIYDKKFEKIKVIHPLHLIINCDFNNISYWYYTFFIDNLGLKKRDKLIKDMLKSGVETRPLFYPLSDMKIYKKFLKGGCNNSKLWSYNSMSIPTYPNLRRKEINYVASTLIKHLQLK